jgi:hypothetical protein
MECVWCLMRFATAVKNLYAQFIKGVGAYWTTVTPHAFFMDERLIAAIAAQNLPRCKNSWRLELIPMPKQGAGGFVGRLVGCDRLYFWWD